jgi:mono/diheme cytochrome c family protein
VRAVLAFIPVAALLALGGCGTESVSVPEDDPTHEGAVLFAERCSGCHTMSPAGTQGSADRDLRNQGPNFDQRDVSYADALFAIRNGGFSGAIMPQNIVVGDEAKAVARFIDEWSGSDVDEPPMPAEDGGSTPPAGG